MRIGNLPVSDATSALTLQITPRDIELGNTKDPGSCAASRACIRQLHAKAARVHLSRVYVLMGDHWVRYATPPSLRTEIVAFDRGGVFVAGTHELAPLRPSALLGADKRKRSKASKRTKVARKVIHRIVDIRAAGQRGGKGGDL